MTYLPCTDPKVPISSLFHPPLHVSLRQGPNPPQLKQHPRPSRELRALQREMFFICQENDHLHYQCDEWQAKYSSLKHQATNDLNDLAQENNQLKGRIAILLEHNNQLGGRVLDLTNKVNEQAEAILLATYPKPGSVTLGAWLPDSAANETPAANNNTNAAGCSSTRGREDGERVMEMI